jgi:hypothetical protein
MELSGNGKNTCDRDPSERLTAAISSIENTLINHFVNNPGRFQESGFILGANIV